LSAVSAEFWILTIAGLVLVIGIDLLLVARRRREIRLRDAVRGVCLYVALAAAFGVALLMWGPGQTGQEFFAGYVTEYSLSVDNLFVFLLIMERFAVPGLARDKVLYIGILMSLLLRAVLISAGAAAVSQATATFYLFGALLVYTAVKLAFESDEDPDFREGWVVRRMRRVMPLTSDYHDDRLVTRHRGRLHATPLVLVIAAIAIANVVFALDSIPAIFGLTQDAFVVLAANAFALMGLRQLYFLIGGLLGRLAYLNVGLALILGFVGLKLFVEALHGSHVASLGAVPLPDISTTTSLLVIVGVLLLTTAASLVRSRVLVDQLVDQPVEQPAEQAVEPADLHAARQ
jgi:tellurite resistance protein TerC